MKKPFNIFKFVGCSVLLLPMAFVFYIWAALAYIAYWSIPPVPSGQIEYSIADAGTDEILQMGLYSNGKFKYLDRGLAANGEVLRFDDAIREADEAQRKIINDNFSKSIGFQQDGYRNQLLFVTANGQALAMKDDSLQIWKNGAPIATKQKGVQGYSWEIYDAKFHKLNARGEAIGNGRLSTGYASSGGFSDPHGRIMALLWRGADNTQSQDLNSLIDPQSNWYLDCAIDINDNGQILCIARQTDAKGAEDYHNNNSHFVVLTPLK